MKGSMHQSIMVVNVLEPATYAAAAEAFTAGIDCEGYDELMLVFHCGTFAGTADVAIQCEESSDNAVADPYVDIAGAAIADTVMVDTADQTVYVMRIDLAKRERWIRVGYDVDDANAIFGIVGLLGSPKYLPVTQTNAAVVV
jgi:hypothetical protein